MQVLIDNQFKLPLNFDGKLTGVCSSGWNPSSTEISNSDSLEGSTSTCLG